MNWILKLFFIFSFLTLSSKAQQEYSANSALNCDSSDVTKPSSALLYSCNGEASSCRAFMLFRAKYPYNSVPAIAALTSSDKSEVARINNVTILTVFDTNKEVIVPVTCSCSGRYFQANTTYHLPEAHETYFLIAKNRYQGLTTCGSIKRANAYSEFSLLPGFELQVPLRCACPTRRQMLNSTKYLLTYSISWNESVSHIGQRFNIAAEAVLEANSFSKKNPTLYPFTTILLPLPTEPRSSQTLIRKDTLAVSPQASHSDRERKSRRSLSVACQVAAGVSLLLLLFIISLIVFLFYKRRAGRAARIRKEMKTKGTMAVDLLVEIASIDRVLKVYQFSAIKKATGNFGPKSRIKGRVYRGVFKGEIRAVKKMNMDVSKEVNILNKINHLNLIKLHGFCEHQGCSYLVFEYMRNGSLKEWLCSKGGENTKSSWSHRIHIAQDVANGLLYLHNFTKPPYVHKNINSSAILLDSNLRAKITNFSLARRAVKGTKDSVMTTRVVGTKGYLAPEYIETGSATSKIDVYAFGVVLLELITGKEAVIIQEGREGFLSAAIITIMRGENAETKLNYFLEPGLAENGGILHALPVVKLSVSCLSRDPADRPSMDEVVSTLLKIQQNVQRGIA